MATAVTPSETKQATQGQIDKAVANYRALLEKHVPNFGTEAVQTVLGQSELAEEQFTVFRKRVEEISKMFVRHFKVDRTKTRRQMIEALGRNEYVSDDVLETMPVDGPEEGDLFFFPIKRNTPASEVAGLLDRHNLIIDPVAQFQVNADDSAFADERPNGVQWQDSLGRYCFAAFGRWRGERGVGVGRDDVGWGGDWWLAGRRK